jgi:2-methylcitrate dehydratase PrpD
LHAPLRDVLMAIVAGYEIGGRLGETLRIREGMHVDGTWGSFAAAAAAAWLIDAASMSHALAIAACQVPASLYLPIPQGATARNIYAAQGVAFGVRSAVAAGAGITGPDGAIGEADRIVFSNQQAKPDVTPAFRILDAYIKPFAGVRHVHYGAACALEWRARHGDVDPSSIAAIELTAYPEALTYCGNRAPRTPLEAQFSLTYGAAHALIHGSLNPDAYSREALRNAETMRLESLMVLDADTSMETRGARLTVTADGESDRVSVSEIAGDAGRPMTEEQVTHKARTYLESRLSPDAATALIGKVLDGNLDAPLDLAAEGAS